MMHKMQLVKTLWFKKSWDGVTNTKPHYSGEGIVDKLASLGFVSGFWCTWTFIQNNIKVQFERFEPFPI